MRSWALLWALGAVGITAACGSSSHNPSGAQAGSAGTSTGGSAGQGSGGAATGGGAAAAPIALEDLCPIFIHDLCIYLMECNGARYKDAEHCERELDCFGLPQLTEAAERGAVDYDASQVGACHARFLESPCTFGFFLFTPDIYDVLAYCPGTVTPQLQAGETCSAHGECSEGLYCYKGIDYQCPGQCRAYSQEGEDCAGSGRCGDELTCQSDVCAPRKQAGDACLLDGCSYSLSCPKDEVCAGNIWCDEELDQCQSGRLVDEECGFLMSGTLTSIANCAVHLWCDAAGVGSGVCHAASAEGGPCNDENHACQDGLHCVGYDVTADPGTFGTCEPPSPGGGDCLRDDDCQAGFSCFAGQCREPGAEGADCNDSDDCQAGLVCPDLTCVSARYPGDACDGMRCTFGRCVDGTCDYHIKVGEPCAAATDCATGYCIDGACYDSSVCNAPEP